MHRVFTALAQAGCAALLACILLYAALLRLDAFSKPTGPYENPRWLASMQPAVG